MGNAEMFIQTEETPNPQTLKFIPGKAVLGDKTAFFTNADEAEVSPLASALFAIGEVKAIFFGGDFVTVTKDAEASWEIIKPLALTTIMEHYTSGNPIMLDEKKIEVSEKTYSEDEQKIVDEIKELIEARVRPAVAQDGGDIIFHSYEEGVVHLEMHGACAGCPSSTLTLKEGIENMLKHYIPEVVSVEPVAA